MSCPDYIDKAFADLKNCVRMGENRVSVTTHCLYPDGGGVAVVVTSLGSEFMVSDGAGAYDCLRDYSKAPVKWDRFLTRFASPYGLIGKSFEIFTGRPVSVGDLPTAIVLVANASKEAAETGMTVLKTERLKRFQDVFDDFVEKKFSKSERVKNYILAGESNKTYHFDYAIHMTNGGMLLTDPVTRDGNSINAKVVSHLDIRKAEIEGISQRIVFDDKEDWPSSDLHLLKMAAPTVPFSKADESFSSF